MGKSKTIFIGCSQLYAEMVQTKAKIEKMLA